MTVRTAHGNARKGGRVSVVETLPVDELPVGVPALIPTPEPARDAGGRYRAGHPATIAAARAAGRAKRDRTALAHTLSVTTSDPAWRAYLRQADAFRAAQLRVLASTVGGGQCGPAPAALVASAALALAGSRHSYTRGDFTLGARLASEARQHLLGAHELCAREAVARRNAAPTQAPWLVHDDEPPARPADALSHSDDDEADGSDESAPASQPGVNDEP